MRINKSPMGSFIVPMVTHKKMLVNALRVRQIIFLKDCDAQFDMGFIQRKKAEGPSINRSGRQSGIADEQSKSSAIGAALRQQRIECRDHGARFYIPLDFGLTTRSIHCRSFEPYPLMNSGQFSVCPVITGPPCCRPPGSRRRSRQSDLLLRDRPLAWQIQGIRHSRQLLMLSCVWIFSMNADIRDT